MSESNRVYIKILDKDYQIACPPKERDALTLAAQELDERMRVIRNTGSIIGLERIAVMAALNLCHELQKTNAASNPEILEANLQRLSDKLEAALEDS